MKSEIPSIQDFIQSSFFFVLIKKAAFIMTKKMHILLPTTENTQEMEALFLWGG